MAFPHYSAPFAGSEIVWAASGGNYALTSTSLAANAAREGVKGDLLHPTLLILPELVKVWLEFAPGSQQANGTQMEAYFGQSKHATAGTDNPGGLTGTDAALTVPDERKGQLTYGGVLNISNNLSTTIQKCWGADIFFPLRYIMPVIINKMAAGLSATAADHRVILLPIYRKIIES